ncbi:MAG: DUF4143 domain-containing protein [Actinomycetota bacterium]|nr:DUF4143 domain-containing protein [Actinomycetota bacterium]
MTYQRRSLDDVLDQLLPQLPAILLEGAKGVGKTSTAERRAATRFHLDNPADLELARGDPERVLASKKPVLIDEWHRYPAIWDAMKRAVDHNAVAASFFLTGSASPDAGAHSGAGRIVDLQMRPLALAERRLSKPTVSLVTLLQGGRGPIQGASALTLADYTNEILRSGFPGLRNFWGRPLRESLDAYVSRVIDRDFKAELGRTVRNPSALRRWLTAYAAATSTTASFETIRKSAGTAGGQESMPTKVSGLSYRDALKRLWIVDPVPGWRPTRNQFGRLDQPEKHHLADPALAARLLGADAPKLLHDRPLGPPMPRDGTLLGALFESLVTLSVRVYAQAAEARVFHLREKSGRHEIDLIVERDDGRVVAIEVKLAAVVDDRDVRHLHYLAGQIKDDLLDMVIVTTGADAYRRQDGVAVVPAALLTT